MIQVERLILALSCLQPLDPARQPSREDGMDSKSQSTAHHFHPHHSGLKHRWARARLPPAPPCRLPPPQPSNRLQPLDSGRNGSAASADADAPPRIPAESADHSSQECPRDQHREACCSTWRRAHARRCRNRRGNSRRSCMGMRCLESIAALKENDVVYWYLIQ